MVPAELAEQRQIDAEERIAVLQTFMSSLLDIASDEGERLYAVAMMAGELANLPSDVRVQMITTQNGTERLRLVLRELASILSLDSARRMAKSLSLGNGSDQVPTDAASLMEAEDAKKAGRLPEPAGLGQPDKEGHWHRVLVGRDRWLVRRDRCRRPREGN